MDRGRLIDQISNTNARFLLDYEDKKTSKNICQPPGGVSSFSLAWGMPDQQSSKKKSNKINNLENNMFKADNNQKIQKKNNYNDYQENFKKNNVDNLNNLKNNYNSKINFNNNNNIDIGYDLEKYNKNYDHLGNFI